MKALYPPRKPEWLAYSGWRQAIASERCGFRSSRRCRVRGRRWRGQWSWMSLPAESSTVEWRSDPLAGGTARLRHEQVCPDVADRHWLPPDGEGVFGARDLQKWAAQLAALPTREPDRTPEIRIAGSPGCSRSRTSLVLINHLDQPQSIRGKQLIGHSRPPRRSDRRRVAPAFGPVVDAGQQPRQSSLPLAWVATPTH